LLYTATNWTSVNPLLEQAELGYELDSGMFKIGNGSDNWDDLDYYSIINEGINLGAGVGIYTTNSGTFLQFKSLVAGDNITLTTDGETITISGAGGGGVTDHGVLTGLGDDDHSQYHNDARGDVRYYRINFETLTLDGDDIDHKYIDLSVAPKTDDSVDLHVYGGLKGAGNVDYTVSGTRINWDSKGWDGILEAGDVIEVVCYY